MKGETVRERLLQLRGDLTQSEVARRMDEFRKVYYPDHKPITRNDVANWEASQDGNTKKRTAIKPSEIHLYALALNSDCSYIITGERTKDQSMISDLGLSQKAIDSIRNNTNGDIPETINMSYNMPTMAEALNFMFNNGFQNIIANIAAFLNTDFKKAYTPEIKGLINWIEGMFLAEKLSKEEYEALPYKTIPYRDVAVLVDDAIRDISILLHVAYRQYRESLGDTDCYQTEYEIKYPEKGADHNGETGKR